MADRRLTRRRVLQRLGLSGAAVTLGPSLLACDDTSTTNLEPADIGPMLDSRPPTSVMAASTSEVDLTLQVLAGALPADLVGHVFVVAPVPNQSGASLLTGDGMVYRLDLGAKQVSLKSRFMRTPSYLVDQATRGTDDAFTTNGLARFSKTYGVRNYANTALVPLDTSRLLVTTDIGRPHLIDPVSLAVITPLGRNDEWRSTFGQTVLFGEAFPLAQTTAHPVWDARTDELFSVNYASPFLNGQETWTDLLRWQGDALERWPILDARTGEPAVVAQSMHQIGVTRRYVILMETAFVVRLNFTGQAQPITPQGSETPVWLIARADLDGDATSVQAHRIVLPSESVHFLADYEDADDLIRMHVCHNRASDPGVWLEPGDVRADTGAPVDERLHGLLGSGTDLVALGRHTVDVSGDTPQYDPATASIVTDDPLMWNVSLYTSPAVDLPDSHTAFFWSTYGFSPELLTQRVVDAYADYGARTVALDQLPTTALPGVLFRVTADTLEIADQYSFPLGRLCLSPQFVPSHGRHAEPTDGYIVATVASDDLSTADTGDEVWIFSAADLAKGPICRLGHDQLDFSFTLHSAYMADIAPYAAAYRVNLRNDYADILARTGAKAETLFEAEVYPVYETGDV